MIISFFLKGFWGPDIKGPFIFEVHGEGNYYIFIIILHLFSTIHAG